ncbi:methylcytosine dioxygenase TET1 [Protopterus annectens]|uniref:methylcytosine dioxygenase TET1 n=1 Tax=Protopterus annectens TaxID=7888 RepID=UPI001CFB78AC|nr:methylcytosine dioxygenase TET1 [Protopterus annectens]
MEEGIAKDVEDYQIKLCDPPFLKNDAHKEEENMTFLDTEDVTQNEKSDLSNLCNGDAVETVTEKEILKTTEEDSESTLSCESPQPPNEFAQTAICRLKHALDFLTDSEVPLKKSKLEESLDKSERKQRDDSSPKHLENTNDHLNQDESTLTTTVHCAHSEEQENLAVHNGDELNLPKSDPPSLLSKSSKTVKEDLDPILADGVSSKSYSKTSYDIDNFGSSKNLQSLFPGRDLSVDQAIAIEALTTLATASEEFALCREPAKAQSTERLLARSPGNSRTMYDALPRGETMSVEDDSFVESKQFQQHPSNLCHISSNNEVSTGHCTSAWSLLNKSVKNGDMPLMSHIFQADTKLSKAVLQSCKNITSRPKHIKVNSFPKIKNTKRKSHKFHLPQNDIDSGNKSGSLCHSVALESNVLSCNVKRNKDEEEVAAQLAQLASIIESKSHCQFSQKDDLNISHNLSVAPGVQKECKKRARKIPVLPKLNCQPSIKKEKRIYRKKAKVIPWKQRLKLKAHMALLPLNSHKEEPLLTCPNGEMPHVWVPDQLHKLNQILQQEMKITKKDERFYKTRGRRGRQKKNPFSEQSMRSFLPVTQIKYNRVLPESTQENFTSTEPKSQMPGCLSYNAVLIPELNEHSKFAHSVLLNNKNGFQSSSNNMVLPCSQVNEVHSFYPGTVSGIDGALKELDTNLKGAVNGNTCFTQVQQTRSEVNDAFLQPVLKDNSITDQHGAATGDKSQDKKIPSTNSFMLHSSGVINGARYIKMEHSGAIAENHSGTEHKVNSESKNMLHDFLNCPTKFLNKPTKNLLDTPLKTGQPELPSCDCVEQFVEKDEGPYYTHLGSGPNIAAVREVMENRYGEKGKAIRIEVVVYTGKEGKSSQGCPIAKWVIRRSSEEEKLLCLVRERAGHHCKSAVIVILILAWDGIPHALADELYRDLTETLRKYGCPTNRRCGTNEDRTCACQGLDAETCGASFSFGCSWSMYFNGCKFARSRYPRKFKIMADDAREEEKLERHLQILATNLAPVYKKLAPEAFENQIAKEHLGSDCRLGLNEGRPFSGVTACMDFCAHAHKDTHNMNNGSTVSASCTVRVCTLTKEENRKLGVIPEDEQLHVLPLYKVAHFDEHGNEEGQVEKIKSGAIQVLSSFPREVRFLTNQIKCGRRRKAENRRAPYGSLKKQSTLGKINNGVADKADINNHQAVIAVVELNVPVEIVKPETLYPVVSFYTQNCGGLIECFSLVQGTKRSSLLHSSGMKKEYRNGPSGFRCAGKKVENSLLQKCNSISPLGGDLNSRQQSLPQTYGYIGHKGTHHSAPPFMGMSANSSTEVLLNDNDSLSHVLSDSEASKQADHVRLLNQMLDCQVSEENKGQDELQLMVSNLYSTQDSTVFQASRRINCSENQFNGYGASNLENNYSKSQDLNIKRLSTMYDGEVSEEKFSGLDQNEKAEEVWSDSEHNFLDEDIGGVAVAPSHGSILIECARHELHATTPLKKPNRNCPTRISLVFYQHKSLNEPNHGLAQWEAKMAERAREREEEAKRLGIDLSRSGSRKSKMSTSANKDLFIDVSDIAKVPSQKTLTLTRDRVLTVSTYALTQVTGPYNRWV